MLPGRIHFCSVLFFVELQQFLVNAKRLSYRRGTARRALSRNIGIYCTTVRKSHLNGLQWVNDLDGRSRSSELQLFDRPRPYVTCHFLLMMVYSDKVTALVAVLCTSNSSKFMNSVTRHRASTSMYYRLYKPF